MYEMEWYDEETNETVTSEDVIGIGENGETFTENVPLDELPDEVFLMPSIPYLMFFVSQVKLPDLIKTFSKQFVSDNMAVWSREEEPV